jgi:uncharacterized protein (TIGR03067 family)
MIRVLYAVALGLLAAGTARADDKAIQRELQALKGRWAVISAVGPGKAVPREELDRLQVVWIFKDEKNAVFSNKEFMGKDPAYTYGIDPSKTPKAIDFTYVGPAQELKGAKQFGIYKLEKGKLTLCLTGSPTAAEQDRPKEFAVKDGAGILLELERPAKK